MCFHPGRSLCATRVNGRLDKIQGCGDKVMACIVQLMISSTSVDLPAYSQLQSHLHQVFDFGLVWVGWLSHNHFSFFREDELSYKLPRDFQRMTPTMTHDGIQIMGSELQFLAKNGTTMVRSLSFPCPAANSQMSLGPKNLVMALSYLAMIILYLSQSFIVYSLDLKPWVLHPSKTCRHRVRGLLQLLLNFTRCDLTFGKVGICMLQTLRV